MRIAESKLCELWGRAAIWLAYFSSLAIWGLPAHLALFFHLNAKQIIFPDQGSMWGCHNFLQCGAQNVFQHGILVIFLKAIHGLRWFLQNGLEEGCSRHKASFERLHYHLHVASLYLCHCLPKPLHKIMHCFIFNHLKVVKTIEPLMLVGGTRIMSRKNFWQLMETTDKVRRKSIHEDFLGRLCIVVDGCRYPRLWLAGSALSGQTNQRCHHTL